MNRFCVFSSSMPPDVSGQSVILQRLLQDVPQDSYCVITYDDNTKQRSSLGRLRVHYLYLRRLPFIELLMRRVTLFRVHRLIAWMLTNIRGQKIARFIAQENVDTLIVCSGSLLDLPAAHLACQSAGVRLIPYFFDDYVNQWRGPLRTLSAEYEARVMNSVSEYYCPNPFLEQEYYKRYSKNGIIVYNLLDRKAVPSLSNRPNHGRKRVVTFAGSVYHANRDIFELLDCALSTHNGPYRFQFILSVSNIGGKETAAFLQRSSFKILHGLGGDELRRLYEDSDLLLLPLGLRTEIDEVIRTSAPGKLAEYLLTGVPILAIVPSNSFVHWYLNTYQCGVTINETEVDSIMERIERALSDKARLKAISENARARAKEDFSFERNFAQFLKPISCEPN